MTKAQVGAVSTQDHKKPTEAPAPPPKPADVPDGNTPVDVQQTQAEHDQKRPIDQP